MGVKSIQTIGHSLFIISYSNIINYLVAMLFAKLILFINHNKRIGELITKLVKSQVNIIQIFCKETKLSVLSYYGK